MSKIPEKNSSATTKSRNINKMSVRAMHECLSNRRNKCAYLALQAI